MILGIDASNLRGGGGVTHLVALLGAANPGAHGIKRVIVWSGTATLARIDDRPWLTKAHEPDLDRGLLTRTLWQLFTLSARARAAGCDLLFVPGGSHVSDFRPVVTMSQNMLPFEWREVRRYGLSRISLRFLLLRATQSWSFRRADGVIFLTAYARDAIARIVKDIRGATTIVPHGIDQRFFRAPRLQLAIDRYTEERPYRILYVSIVDMYKHQWRVAEAVAQLRAEGIPVSLDLIGPAYAPALRRLRSTIKLVDPAGRFIRYSGAVAHDELEARYGSADFSVFASSCENMPNILLEIMASGLPVVCSNRGPMPEMLGDGGLYADPEDAQAIAGAIRRMIESPVERARAAHVSFERAHAFSWERCAAETFQFLSAVVASAHCTYGNTRANSVHSTIPE